MKVEPKNDPLDGTFTERWTTVPFGALFRESQERNGGNIVGEALSVSEYRGVVPRDVDTGQMESEDVSTYRVVRPGQLAVNVMWLNRTGLGVSDYTGYVSPAYKVFTINRAVEPRFADFVLRSSVFRSAFERLGRGVRPNAQMVDTAELRHLSFPLPAVAEQRAIAGYLDRETAKIDALIEKQTELIARLQERRAAAAEQLVVGLAEHPVRKMKYLYRPSTEVNPGDVQVLSVYRDYGVIPKNSRTDNINVTPVDLSRYLLVKPGWLVVNKMKAWQGSLGVSRDLGIVSPDYEVLTQTSGDLLPEFVHEVLRSPVYAREFRVRSVGIRPVQWRLYWDQLGQVQIPVPPREVQRDVVAQVHEDRSKVDELIGKTERIIELSRERRSALITAAVTGQTDVTEGAA